MTVLGRRSLVLQGRPEGTRPVVDSAEPIAAIDLSVPPFHTGERVSLGTTQRRSLYHESLAGAVDAGQLDLVLVSTIDVIISCDTPLELRDAARRLARLLGGPWPVWLMVNYEGTDPDPETTPATSVVQIGRQVADISQLLDAPDVSYLVVTIEIESRDDPYWQAVDTNGRRVEIGVDSSQPWIGWTPSNAGIDSDADIPSDGYYLPDAGSPRVPLINEGDIQVWPSWRVYGPALAVSIDSHQAGQVIAFDSLNLTAQETLIVDTDPKHPQVRIINRVGTAVASVEAWDKMAKRSRFFPLESGLNPIDLKLTGGTTGQSGITCFWNDRSSTC